MEEIKVSIITIAYNCADTIAQTIESVLSQNYSDIEYIIIDGNSTDGTQDIIRKYEDKISYWVSEPDEGIYDAMNKGLKHATGEIIGIINSDDWYEQGAIRKVVDIYQKKPFDMLYGEINFIDEAGEVQGQSVSSCFPPHPSMFVARRVYLKYGMFDTTYKIASDHEFKLRLYAKGVAIIHIKDVLANFRLTGVSSVNVVETLRETYEINKKYIGLGLPGMLTKEDVENNYKRAMLKELICSNPADVCQILRRKYEGFDQGVLIFGAGVWGERFYQLLQNDVSPLLVTDNNQNILGNAFGETTISSTEVCREFKGVIVVTAVKAQDEISKQIRREFNQEAKVITVDMMCNELVESF